MAQLFKMPQLGISMTEGAVNKWFKAVGDKVAIGDVLVEVETEKINNEVEAPVAGTILKILVETGATVPVQTPLAWIGEAGEKIEDAGNAAPKAAAPASAAVPVAAAAPVAAPVASGGEAGFIKASPIAKRLAKEQGIDIAAVPGTGPEGRIVERDIAAYASAHHVKATPLAAKLAAEHGVDLSKVSAAGRIMKDDVLAAAARPAPAMPASGTPLSGMRRVIAERMAKSWNLAPHVTMTVEVDMSAATEMRTRLAEAAGKKVSFTEIVTKCAARALTEAPYLNASLIDNKIVLHDEVNIGMAVALDDGLIVPVIRNADQKSVFQLGEEIRTLSEKARTNKLTPDNMVGGTFTITNLGMFGIDSFTPIINQPESAILGVCRIAERPVKVAGAVVFKPMMNLCLSMDHRLVDGAVGAKFLARLRQLLEQPLLLL